jgi:23S rRNA pseudouridine2605 synthase
MSDRERDKAKGGRQNRPSSPGEKRAEGAGHAERLQKILSAAGVASRRLAEELILQGRVSVNGTVVTELGTKADPAKDDIRVDDRRLHGPQRHRYILLNKPRGYVTTRADPQGRPTVMDLLKRIREYVYPVGRLDYDSEGLLLLTNDGDLAARLTHPRHEVDRVYEARVRGIPGPHELERLERGIVIEGRRTAPAKVKVSHTPAGTTNPQAVLLLSIHEGRHRQVRNMLDEVGHPVVRLRRVRIGPIFDDALKTGHYRELTPMEVAKLKRAAGIGGRPEGPRQT